ncbi:MAG TPA: oligoribonuclease [Gammaproteobacteria bacterium]|nr:oligoribonuclease [Gammaproteobacteria bacterium]
MTEQPSNLVWIDCEMTGLDPEKEQLIEIAVLVSDSNLNIIAEGPSLAIHQPEEILNNMNEWCTNQHTHSGLVERVRKSKITVQDAQNQVLAFIQQYVKPNQSPLCGNTIGQDRRFLARYMPKLEGYFHYRNLDVSTVKELARRWAPDVFNAIQKKSLHLAMDDIKESLEELRFYRDHFFKLS